MCLAGPQGFHDCVQMTEMTLHPDQPHPSCQFRDGLCAPRPLRFPGDKWRLPVPRKLEVYWGNQSGEPSSSVLTSHGIAWPAGLFGGTCHPCPRFLQITSEAIGWSMAKPPSQMLLGQVCSRLRLGAFSPTPAPTQAHIARPGRWCPRGISAAIYSLSLRMEPLRSLPLLRWKVELPSPCLPDAPPHCEMGSAFLRPHRHASDIALKLDACLCPSASPGAIGGQRLPPMHFCPAVPSMEWWQ